jgi:hypothetical protein
MVLDVDELSSELAEIDENLIRNPLTKLEESEQMKRRKEIYEILHPESKVHNNQYSAKRNYCVQHFYFIPLFFLFYSPPFVNYILLRTKLL